MLRKMIEQGDQLIDQVYVNDATLKKHLDACKYMRDEGLVGTKDVRLLASVPMEFVEKFINDQGVTWAEFMRNTELQTRMINDPALAGFRIQTGRA